MNTDKILKKLKRKYPGKNIIFNPRDNPTEIVCEIDPTSEHPEKSLAMAVVGKSLPHYHKKTTEIYEVIKGKLTVYKNGKKFLLKEKDKMTIELNVTHYVEGDETWFLTYSKPGWTLKDHILKKDNK